QVEAADNERNAAIARAEAAEKRVKELEAENELLTYEIGHEIVERNRYLANLAAAAECTPDDNEFPDALTDRIVNAITDLRTKLAAQGWQPVTEPPKKDGMYLVWRGHNVEPLPGWAEISGYATRSDVWRIDYPY